VSTLVVDKAGRRVLLLISGVVMAVPMASLGAFFYLTSGDPDSLDPAWRSSLEWVPLVCLIVYMIGYSVGFACVPFLLLGELLPSR
jgi:facilitated trehalose transporter